MVKVLKTFESPDKNWIESITFSKAYQVLMFSVKMKNHNTGEIDEDLYELGTSNEDIIRLRDFLNGLKLSERNDKLTEEKYDLANLGNSNFKNYEEYLEG